jgi:SAM-dependent methyltransferase
VDDDERAALAEQYADAENLRARVALHESHEVADRDWWAWVFDHYEGLPTDADVIEVGCGPGDCWRATADRVPAGWDLLLTDFSAGMAVEARETVAEAGLDADVAVAAAESVPLPRDCVDAVLANHVLYHVDRAVAVPELRRVLRPGGRLFATTNGESNLRELHAMLDHVGYDPPELAFSLENGPDQLAGAFESVRVHERDCHPGRRARAAGRLRRLAARAGRVRNRPGGGPGGRPARRGSRRDREVDRADRRQGLVVDRRRDGWRSRPS